MKTPEEFLKDLCRKQFEDLLTDCSVSDLPIVHEGCPKDLLTGKKYDCVEHPVCAECWLAFARTELERKDKDD